MVISLFLDFIIPPISSVPLSISLSHDVCSLLYKLGDMTALSGTLVLGTNESL